MEVVICRLQVAGQNLQKELNVLSGSQIFPSSSNRTFITMVFGDIIFSTGSRKTGISDLSSINRFFSPRSFFSAQLQKRPVPCCYRRLPYLRKKWKLHSHGDPIYMFNSTKQKIKFDIGLKAKRNFDEIHVGCTPWIADTWKVDH